MKITGEIHKSMNERFSQKWDFTLDDKNFEYTDALADLLSLILDTVPEGETKRFTVTIDVG